MTGRETLSAILDLARWAPSGDNTQPWRFQIAADDQVVVHGFDTREHCVYDLDGHSSQLALGGLLESMRIAAGGHGLAATVSRRAGMPETRPTFDVRFAADTAVGPSPLAACIRTRTVQRRAMGLRSLTAAEKAALEASVGGRYRVHWLEGLPNRWRAARLMWLNAGLRLTMPEAFEVHRSIIEWNARYSEDRIPDQALGASAASVRFMRFALQRWSRVAFLNKWLGGTLAPRLELDLVPALCCGAHLLLSSAQRCETVDDFVAAGGAMQRLWLTAASLGLQLQPEMTPLIFSRYAVQGRRFSSLPGAETTARKIAKRLAELFGAQATANAVFMARIGAGKAARARSLRLPLEKLLVQGEP